MESISASESTFLKNGEHSCWYLTNTSDRLVDWARQSIAMTKIKTLSDIDSSIAFHIIFSGALESRISPRRFMRFIASAKELQGWDMIILNEQSKRGNIWDNIDDREMIASYETYNHDRVLELGAIMFSKHGFDKFIKGESLVILRPHLALISHHQDIIGLPFRYFIFVLIVTMLIIFLIIQLQKGRLK